jgi:hypothetical protein
MLVFLCFHFTFHGLLPVSELVAKAVMLLKNHGVMISVSCMISGFCCSANEIFTFLGRYTALIGS